LTSGEHYTFLELHHFWWRGLSFIYVEHQQPPLISCRA